MNRKTKCLVASLWVTVAMLASSAPAWSADTALEIEQVKQQTMAVPSIQRDVAKATGNDAKMIEIATTPHKVTITVINSKLNDAKDTDREAEASTMVSTFALQEQGLHHFME